MRLISNFVYIRENGDRIPYDMPLTEQMEVFPEISKLVAVEWLTGGTTVTIKLDTEIRAVEPLPDLSGVIVVESRKTAPDNAVILNPDGTQRLRLKNPYPENDHFEPTDKFEFAGINSEDGKIELIVAVTAHSSILSGGINAEWAYEIDPSSGRFVSRHAYR